jgi:cytochrome c551/c552
MSEVSTKNSAKGTESKKPTPSKSTGIKPTETKKPAASKAITYEEVRPLLQKYTCTSCHNPTKKQVGPAFSEVAKRKYSIDRIVQLIYNPEPKNWPDYAISMPPMPQVPKADAQKIASWIRSLP